MLIKFFSLIWGGNLGGILFDSLQLWCSFTYHALNNLGHICRRPILVRSYSFLQLARNLEFPCGTTGWVLLFEMKLRHSWNLWLWTGMILIWCIIINLLDDLASSMLPSVWVYLVVKVLLPKLMIYFISDGALVNLLLNHVIVVQNVKFNWPLGRLLFSM